MMIIEKSLRKVLIHFDIKYYIQFVYFCNLQSHSLLQYNNHIICIFSLSSLKNYNFLIFTFKSFQLSITTFSALKANYNRNVCA